jgi:hypothetical protein
MTENAYTAVLRPNSLEWKKNMHNAASRDAIMVICFPSTLSITLEEFLMAGQGWVGFGTF